MSTPRPTPPMTADERSTLEGWLEFYRATLAAKCEGLTEDQVRFASVPPSALTLLGLVQHAAEVERNWFRRVLAGESAPAIYGPAVHPQGHDGGFNITAESSLNAALETWQREIEQARSICAQRSLDHPSAFAGGEVSLRWIYTHMATEYARHCGHADLIRERIDGAAGV